MTMDPSFKVRLQRTVGITVLFVFLAIGYLLFFMRTGVGIPCIVKMLTGWMCPGCGITHALASLLRLEWGAAWQANPFVYPALLYGLALYGFSAYGYLRTGRYRVGLPWEWVNVLFLSLLILWGIARNFF
jgi:hypothetical protein